MGELVTPQQMFRDAFGTDPTDCPWCRCCKKALCQQALKERVHCVVLVQAGREATVRDCPCCPPSPVDEGNPDR